MREPGALARVMIVDDHEVVRRGVIAMVTAAGFDVVAEAGSVRDALVRGAAVRPDIAVIDLQLPDGTGLDVVGGLAESSEHTSSIILTAFSDDRAQQGAKAFVLKSVDARSLMSALQVVAGGGNLLAGQVSARSQDPLVDLTPAQRAIVALMVRGMSNREIADELGVAEKTVKNHVTAILSRLGLARRTQVVAWMSRLNGEREMWRRAPET